MAPKKTTKKKKTRVVYCTWYRHPKTGRIVRASDYGKKAFRFEV